MRFGNTPPVRPPRGQVAVGILFVLLPALAAAHWQRPEDVLAELRAPETRAAFGIVSAAVDPALARLLVVRADHRWRAVPEGARRDAAEAWLAHWRAAVPQGIVTILDDATARPLVNFDATGRAIMKDDIAPAP